MTEFQNIDFFRLKACLKPKHKDLLTIHHELGHVQYIMQYSKQLVEFRNSPNLGANYNLLYVWFIYSYIELIDLKRV